MRKPQLGEVIQLGVAQSDFGQSSLTGCRLTWLPWECICGELSLGCTVSQHHHASPGTGPGAVGTEVFWVGAAGNLPLSGRDMVWGSRKQNFHLLVRCGCSLTTSSCCPVSKATEMGLWGSSGLCHTSLPVHEPPPAVAPVLPFTNPSVCAQGADH